MPTLHATLWEQTNDELRYRLKFLEANSKITRKGDMIDHIKMALSGSRLKAALDQLDELGRLAVAEAIHSDGKYHDAQLFHAKYGRDALFFKPEEKPSYSSRSQNPSNSTLLNVFFYYELRSRIRTIPSDLAAALLPLLPAPPKESISCIPEPLVTENRWRRHTETEALSELGSMLRLAANGKLSYGEKTGIPSKSALADMEAALISGDWYPPDLSHIKNPQPWQTEIGSIKPIGWTRMLLCAGLVSKNGSKSILTPQGRKAVDSPAWEIVAMIWKKWLANKKYDEFNRIDIIKGQSVKGSLTATVPRRAMVMQALEKCPSGEWMSFEEFSRYMRATGITFEVSNDPWKLYIADRQYGALGYDGYGDWDVLQERYMLCILMEYAATLGLVDIVFGLPDRARPVDNWGMDSYAWLSRYDGLEAIRINSLGAYVISGGKTSFQPTQPTIQVRLSVLEDLTIRVTSGNLSPTERIQLETWARPVGDNVYQLDETLALNAVESGQEPQNFETFLEERFDQPLPESTHTLLGQAYANGNALRQSSPAILFECRDARTADDLFYNKDLAKLCLRAGESTLAVRENDLAKFRRQIRLLGLGIRG